jgi:hypothetical protein
MNTFDNYLKQVKEITKLNSPMFYESVRREFDSELLKQPQRKYEEL